MTKGIIIIATKSHIYGKMAYNLTLTIKATGTTIPVCLIHDSAAIAHLRDEELVIFDDKIKSDWDWNKIRFNVDKLSPYDQTLQLDADMLWLYKDPVELFDKYADEELLVTNEGYYDIESKETNLTGNYIWLADLQETIKLYDLKGKLYQMRWEMLLFKKTDNVRKMMKKAEAIRKNPKLETWKFEGQTVDEFCFYVACNIFGLDQKKTPFIPSFWCRTRNNPYPGQLNRDGYYAVGFGGIFASPGYRDMYDTLMGNACAKMGLPYKFKLQSKSNHITSRSN
jgi:hypothetical protein